MVARTLRHMIVRLLTATVKADRAGPFNALMRSQLPILRQYPGLVYVKLARRITGDIEEVCDRVIIIHSGRILLDVTVAELKRRYPRYRHVTLEEQPLDEFLQWYLRQIR